jgi:inosose dehydratase
MKDFRKLSRRDLVKAGAAFLAATPLASLEIEAKSRVKIQKGSDPWAGLKVGVASYSLRLLPRDEAIKAINRVGLKFVSIKSNHIPLELSQEERRAAAKQFRDAGITPLSAGNFNMNAPDEAAIRKIFEYARDIEVSTIVCTPKPETLPILDKLVKEFNIKAAIHNHGPKAVYPSPYDAMARIESLDKRVGICIDIGHTARAGVDPAESVLKCRDRLYDMHIKDIYELTVDARNAEVGRGVLDIRSVFEALVKIKYQHLVGFEYEKDEKDPLPGLAESVGYTRGIMSSVNA